MQHTAAVISTETLCQLKLDIVQIYFTTQTIAIQQNIQNASA